MKESFCPNLKDRFKDFKAVCKSIPSKKFHKKEDCNQGLITERWPYHKGKPMFREIIII